MRRDGLGGLRIPVLVAAGCWFQPSEEKAAMRLDQAGNVLSKPKVPSMPTRRAFVISGCTFAMGLTVGGACGYSAVVAAAGVPADGAGAAVADPDLHELRRLAVVAPIDELMVHRAAFISLISDTYRHDEVLWRGGDRLCDAVLRGPVPEGRLLALALCGVIERGEEPLAAARRHRLEALRQVR